jgi:hypothetical protein
MTNSFTTCDRCGREIAYGKAQVTITRNIEQAEHNILENRDEIEVIDSEQIMTLCGSCGNSFDAHKIAQIINSIPTDDNNSTSN